MEFGDHQEEIGMPMSVSYDSVHESSKLKMLTVRNGAACPEEIRPPEAAVKKSVRYRDCLKNHAATIGGHAVDGCGEFMPSGEEGTLEALKCAACNCHRNFHRREVEGEPSCYYCHKDNSSRKRSAFMTLNPHTPLALPLPHMALTSAAIGDNDDGHDHVNVMGFSGMPTAMPVMKKRFRTKFSQEQKEKMFVFADKLGWRIQKHDEADVQQFCAETGVKRHVLKVWMHNNKHTLGKKL
eukprot:Gb_15163 [translate_table: standard]